MLQLKHHRYKIAPIIFYTLNYLGLQSVTRPGVSFHPAIKREFVGKRPRVEPDTVDDLLEVKKEQEENDNKDLKIEDQEKVQEIEKDNIDGKHFEEIAKPR